MSTPGMDSHTIYGGERVNYYSDVIIYASPIQQPSQPSAIEEDEEVEVVVALTMVSVK